MGELGNEGKGQHEAAPKPDATYRITQGVS
jgi:hypothetical protein